jgi:hypothetical protein
MPTRPQPDPATIVCEISAPHTFQAGALADIARVCARDVGQAIVVKKQAHGAAGGVSVLTLLLSAELAGSQHRVWCLACCLACFCPEARVSVLVRGENLFRENITEATAPSVRSRSA